MPLITITPAPVLTPEQQTIKTLSNDALKEFNSHLASAKMAVNRVWKNGRGLTPQQVITAMGTEAVKNFGANARALAYLSAQSSDLFDAAANTDNQAAIAAIEAIAKPYTAHPDGTITVNP